MSEQVAELVEVGSMSYVELCQEVAKRRGLQQRVPDDNSPYAGWFDPSSNKYADIRYCSDPAAAWDLLEWVRSQGLMIVMENDMHFPACTQTYVTRETPTLADPHGWDREVKRSFVCAVLEAMRKKEQLS